MKNTKIIAITILILIMESTFSAPKIPRFSGYSNTSPNGLIGRTKFKKQNVDKHDGYKVIDKYGNISYVDNIKKPKHQVNMLSINGESATKSQLKNVDSQIQIKKLCFKHC